MGSQDKNLKKLMWQLKMKYDYIAWLAKHDYQNHLRDCKSEIIERGIILIVILF
jgi:hypothetical protein